MELPAASGFAYEWELERLCNTAHTVATAVDQGLIQADLRHRLASAQEYRRLLPILALHLISPLWLLGARLAKARDVVTNWHYPPNAKGIRLLRTKKFGELARLGYPPEADFLQIVFGVRPWFGSGVSPEPLQWASRSSSKSYVPEPRGRPRPRAASEGERR